MRVKRFDENLYPLQPIAVTLGKKCSHLETPVRQLFGWALSETLASIPRVDDEIER